MQTQPNNPEAAREKDFLHSLGPGLITGAADDDPSGIATYSQVGAQFGFALLWTMLFTFPLMAAIQEICGRLGRITGTGIATSLGKRYSAPVPLLRGSAAGGGEHFQSRARISRRWVTQPPLVIGGKPLAYAVGFGAFSLLLQIFVPYRRYVTYLRWLTLALFAYVATLFVIHVPWGEALEGCRAAVISSERRNTGWRWWPCSALR